MARSVFARIAALLLALALLIANALPAFAATDPTKCVRVKDKVTGYTTITCPDGNWD
jgi:hypothetical protein